MCRPPDAALSQPQQMQLQDLHSPALNQHTLKLQLRITIRTASAHSIHLSIVFHIVIIFSNSQPSSLKISYHFIFVSYP